MNEKEQDINFKSLFLPFTTKKAVFYIFLLGFIVFFFSIFNGFVGDDFGQIVNNTRLNSLGNIFSYFSTSTFYNQSTQSFSGGFYRPLMLAYFSLVHVAFGANPFFFHLIQVILYTLSSALLFLVLKHFFKLHIAFFLSLIFLIHPMNSEIALYVSDTQDVFFFLFGLLALLILQSNKSIKAILLSSICLFISLFAKETAILFVLITTIYVFFYQKRNIGKYILISGFLFCIYFLVRFHAIGIYPQTAPVPIWNTNILIRLLNLPAIFFFYLQNFAFPINLSITFQWVHTEINLLNFVIPLVIDVMFLVAITSLAIFIFKKYDRKYNLKFLFFMSWFFIGIIPYLQFIPLDATVVDRWFYFPMVGVLGMLAVIYEKINYSLKQKLTLILTILLLVIFSGRTFIRSLDFKDNLTLENNDIKVSKEAFDLENQLGFTYYAMGSLNEAKMHAEKSIKLFPNATNYNLLGAIYVGLSNYPLAKASYEKALRYGDNYFTFDNLAALSLIYGNDKENINFIKNTALKKVPKDSILWNCLALLEYRIGNLKEAKDAITRAHDLDKHEIISKNYNLIMNNVSLTSKRWQ